MHLIQVLSRAESQMFNYQGPHRNRPHRNQLYKRLAYLITAALLLTGATAHAAPPAKGHDKPKAKHVIVAPVVVKQISDRVEALGTARATESVNITSNVTEKITRIDFEDGQQVKAGAILAVLDQALANVVSSDLAENAA